MHKHTLEITPGAPYLLSSTPSQKPAPAILLVDPVASNRNTLRAILRPTSGNIFECSHAREALEILAVHEVDLIVIDTNLPGMTGFELCRWLKVNAPTQLIPVLMIASSPGAHDEIEAFSAGADECVARPLNPMLVSVRVSALLRHKSVTDSLESAESILFTLAQAVERRDPLTGEHCHRLAVYSVALGKAVGVSQMDLLALYRAGYLHDIGKIGVPDAILFKNGALSPREWEVMRGHPEQGEAICRPMKSVAPVLPIIRHHHERWDGSGYPDGLRGDGIPLLARILQVCDIYDALTNVRSYKAALSPDDAASVLMAEARRGWRDPEIVNLFLDICKQSFAGIMVPNALDFTSMLALHHSIRNVAE